MSLCIILLLFLHIFHVICTSQKFCCTFNFNVTGMLGFSLTLLNSPVQQSQCPKLPEAPAALTSTSCRSFLAEVSKQRRFLGSESTLSRSSQALVAYWWRWRSRKLINGLVVVGEKVFDCNRCGNRNRRKDWRREFDTESQWSELQSGFQAR